MSSLGNVTMIGVMRAGALSAACIALANAVSRRHRPGRPRARAWRQAPTGPGPHRTACRGRRPPRRGPRRACRAGRSPPTARPPLVPATRAARRTANPSASLTSSPKATTVAGRSRRQELLEGFALATRRSRPEVDDQPAAVMAELVGRQLAVDLLDRGLHGRTCRGSVVGLADMERHRRSFSLHEQPAPAGRARPGPASPGPRPVRASLRGRHGTWSRSGTDARAAGTSPTAGRGRRGT